MANVVLLFGHGSFDPKENPAKVAVPTGCKFCLFARHKEHIHGDRMSDLSYYVSQYNKNLLGSVANLLAHEKFKDEMMKGHHLRRIKTGGDQVHNYRLFPPVGLTLNMCDEDSETPVKLVTVQDDKGVTLESLFKMHGADGTVLMWVACRSVNGIDGRVDGYGLPPTITEVRSTATGKMVPLLHRSDGYFKGEWPTQ